MPIRAFSRDPSRRPWSGRAFAAFSIPPRPHRIAGVLAFALAEKFNRYLGPTSGDHDDLWPGLAFFGVCSSAFKRIGIEAIIGPPLLSSKF